VKIVIFYILKLIKKILKKFLRRKIIKNLKITIMKITENQKNQKEMIKREKKIKLMNLLEKMEIKKFVNFSILLKVVERVINVNSFI